MDVEIGLGLDLPGQDAAVAGIDLVARAVGQHGGHVPCPARLGLTDRAVDLDRHLRGQPVARVAVVGERVAEVATAPNGEVVVRSIDRAGLPRPCLEVGWVSEVRR